MCMLNKALFQMILMTSSKWEEVTMLSLEATEVNSSLACWDPSEVDQKLCLAMRSRERELMEFMPRVPRMLAQRNGAGVCVPGHGCPLQERPLRTCRESCHIPLRLVCYCFHDEIEKVTHFSELSGI